MSGVSRASAVVLFLAVAMLAASGGLFAQSRGAGERATIHPALLVARSPGAAAPAAPKRGRPQAAPAPLSADQKQQLIKTALPGYVLKPGIAAPLRLDPKVVYVPGKAHLSLDGVEEMYPDQGFALFSPSTVAFGASLTVSFKPSTADRPMLVDYVLHQSGAGTVGLITYPGSSSQTVTLSEGDHHVSLVVQPADTGWFSVRLNFYEAPNKPVSYFYYCELTPL